MRTMLRQLALVIPVAFGCPVAIGATTGTAEATTATATTTADDAQTTQPEEVQPKDVRAEYFIKPAGSWYEAKGNALSWRSPALGETHYLGVRVRNTHDDRILPNCKVTVTIRKSGSNTAVISTATLPLQWTPEEFHYGANIAVPNGSDTIDVEARIEPPTMARQDKVKGAFFTRPATLKWTAVKVPALKPQETETQTTDTGSFGPGRYPAMQPTPYIGTTR